MSRSRCWFFTLNKRDGEDLPTKPTFRDPIRYLKYQLERGEGGRLHFQGVLVLDRQHSLDVVKRTLAVDHVHLEVCRSVKHAIAYCGKVETRVDGPWEFGELPKGQGARTDLQKLIESIDATTTMQTLAQSAPGMVVKFGSGLKMLLSLQNPPRRREELRVFCLWGASGVGKSYAIWDMHPGLYSVFDKKTPWMNGYMNQRTVLFDDYGPGMMNIHALKVYLDVYKCLVPTKGGDVAWNPTTIFLTSNVNPMEWYPTVGPDDVMALMRRMHTTRVETREEVEAWKATIGVRGQPEAELPAAAAGAASSLAVEVDSESEVAEELPADAEEGSDPEATLVDDIEEVSSADEPDPPRLKRTRLGSVFQERAAMLAQIQADVRGRL